MKGQFNRRQFLFALGLMKSIGPLQLLALLHKVDMAYAASDRQYLITIRTVFDLKDAGRTNFGADLQPLAAYQNQMTAVSGLAADGGGSEYHNGKQKRYATACTPGSRNNATYGGGSYNGKSFDLVAGQHLKSKYGSKENLLVLGAFPYSSLATTFEGISFANKSQYIRPEYNMAKVVNNIKGDSKVCGSQNPMTAIELTKENKVIESLMLDISRSGSKVSGEVKEQLQTFEAKFSDVRAGNLRKIAEAEEFNNTCVNIRTNPVGHSYTRGSTVAGKYETQCKAMNHAAGLALSLNYTRSVTLNYNFSGHGQGGVRAYHNYTHPGGFTRSPTAEEKRALTEISSFQINMFAHLLKELSNLGILNKTLVVYSPHERPTHNHRDVPIIAYGSNRKGVRRVSREVHDVGRDVLEHFSVPNAANFGGEKAKGGII